MIIKFHHILSSSQTIVYGETLDNAGAIVPIDALTIALPLYQGNTYISGSGYTPIGTAPDYLQKIEYIYLYYNCSYWTGLTTTTERNGNCVKSLIPGNTYVIDSSISVDGNNVFVPFDIPVYIQDPSPTPTVTPTESVTP